MSTIKDGGKQFRRGGGSVAVWLWGLGPSREGVWGKTIKTLKSSVR